MKCPVCGSEEQGTFTAEIAVHFPGLNGLTKPIVWVFPKLVACLHCGFTHFNVPERELKVLREDASANGACAA